MQSINLLENAVLAVVGGDLEAVSLILAARHSDLLQAAKNLPELTITKAALVRVLTTWNGDKDTAGRVQQWASFVRRGMVCRFVSGTPFVWHEPIKAIDIVYDEKDEDLIAEIIGRFDELGDEIDGEIDDQERYDMLRALSA